MVDPGEVVLVDLEGKQVARALAEWFERDPYIAGVWTAMPQADRQAVIEKVAADATEAGFMRIDAPVWLEHHVNNMYDLGALPEIRKAQEALSGQAQAVEDNFIQNADRKQVEKWLTANYKDPQVKKMQLEEAEQMSKRHEAIPEYPG